MRKIDFSQAQASETAADVQMRSRAQQVKSNCAERILAVLDAQSQINIQAAALTGGLTPEEQSTFAQGCRWITQTQEACRAAMACGDAPIWPEVPPGLADLAKRF